MANPFSRRDVLAATGALTAAGLFPRSARAANPDVVVIGAGAAGIAAAQTLLKKGQTVAVLEATDRIGGRVHTDHSIFGEPYDMGAHWLHIGKANPFVGYGQKHGFDIYRSPDHEILYVGDREASDAEYGLYEKALNHAYSAISRAGEQGRDVSPASVIKRKDAWDDLAHMVIGPWSMGKDFADFSCADWYSGPEGSNWYCREGFGAVWAHGAQGVPVELSTPATGVDWRGKGVRVDTPKGTLQAKACIVTVSTGVLARDTIRFDPALPSKKQESFHGISMGLYNHIAFQFRRNIFGTRDDGYLLFKVGRTDSGSPRGFGMLTNIGGASLSFGDVGGNFARDLEKQGTDAALAYGLEVLRRMFGGGIDKEFVKGHVTTWGQNPYTLGSYASAKPGARTLRSALRAPVGDRIWFAGEACSPDLWATVAGAHKSGVDTAKQMAGKLI